MTSVGELVESIGAFDFVAAAKADDLHARLAKPPGALGRLEDLGAQLCGIAGACPPPMPEPAMVAVFAGDHGVLAQGVSPWPKEVTALMVANFLAGGAAINVLARQAGVGVVVVDVGVDGVLAEHPSLLARKIRRGTADITNAPAMSDADAEAAIGVGMDIAAQLVGDGARCLVTGDMGIANTTPSAALIAALTGQPPAMVTGRGTGIDDATLRHKVQVVEAALRRAGELPPLDLLASVGGLEIAGLVGFVLGGASQRVPVVIDGVIALAATLVAAALAPTMKDFCIAGHRSSEPGATIALDHLGLRPLLDLGLRLGEGSGACLAVPIVRSAAAVLREMATLDEVLAASTQA